MQLEEFLLQTQSDVNAEIGDRLGAPGEAYPYPELVFAEVVMEHMSDIGMTFDARTCHYSARVGNANLKLSGYAISDEGDELDLFVSLYSGTQTLIPIPEAETKTAAEQCLRFLSKCADGTLAQNIDTADDAYALVLLIQGTYEALTQIRIYVLTDRQAKTKSFKPREISGRTVKLEVMDIERLFRHWAEGKPRDELVVNFEEVSGAPLPCIYIPGHDAGYDCALAAIPGEVLRFIYEKYGAQLLEANVRSFLSATGKVNRGIRDSLRDDPSRFMAYNNGIVLVADQAHWTKTEDGGTAVTWLKGMQIVNGGQTTASIYFTKKRNAEVDLSRVRVPTKIIVLHEGSTIDEEGLISDISKYANSQNSVKLSDLSANKPFHVQIEKLALETYCPDGISRWFYERAAGSYNVMLAREGNTPARLRQLKLAIPSARKITKTDLAKYLTVWEERPDLVSLGSQKNFERFMERVSSAEGGSLLDVAAYKALIAKVIIYKQTQRMVRPMFPAFQGNVATYVVALMANRLGARLNLDRIWQQQDLSDLLRQQIQAWATEVNAVLIQSAAGRMISEWAKKPECWEAVKNAAYSSYSTAIPELN
jgi:hypothetical protein